MALVYEYMDGGNLEDRLRGKQAPPSPPSETIKSPIGAVVYLNVHFTRY